MTDTTPFVNFPWPVDQTAFDAALAEIGGEVGDDRQYELALALACAAGDRKAQAELESYFDGIDAALGRMKLDDDLVDEVKQEVRRKLLVGDPPKLVGYAGRGSLRGLLKVTATRTAISMLRKLDRMRPGDDAIVDRSGEKDPELSFLKQKYRGAFAAAFEHAVDALDSRERNLLRMHFLRKVTLEKLATMYRVDRSTIVRQIAKVRDKLDRETKAQLRAALEIEGGPTGAEEIEEVMDLIRSRMDVSVDRLLATVHSLHD